MEPNFKDIQNFLEKDLTIKTPFKNHALKSSEIYIKNLYSTMLAMIVQYENEPKREQLRFLNHIFQGIEVGEDIATVLNKAQLIDSKFVQEFYLEFTNSPLVESFLIDALILIKCSGQSSEKQMDLLIEIINSFDLDSFSFLKCLEMAKVLIEQDKNMFYVNICYRLDLKKLGHFQSYISTDYNTVYGGSYIKKGTVKNIKEMIDENLNSNFIFEECEISLDWNGLEIQEQNTLIFRNCTFSNFSSSLEFNNVNYLIFENCHFRDSEIKMIKCYSVANIVFKNCMVENITHSKVEKPVGGFLSSSTKTNMYLVNNTFKDISIRGKYYGDTFGVVIASSLRDYYFEGNIFVNCHSANPGGWDGLIFSKMTYDWQGGHYYPENRFENGNQLNWNSFKDFLEKELDIRVEINQMKNNSIENCKPENIFYPESRSSWL